MPSDTDLWSGDAASACPRGAAWTGAWAPGVPPPAASRSTLASERPSSSRRGCCGFVRPCALGGARWRRLRLDRTLTCRIGDCGQRRLRVISEGERLVCREAERPRSVRRRRRLGGVAADALHARGIARSRGRTLREGLPRGRPMTGRSVPVAGPRHERGRPAERAVALVMLAEACGAQAAVPLPGAVHGVEDTRRRTRERHRHEHRCDSPADRPVHPRWHCFPTLGMPPTARLCPSWAPLPRRPDQRTPGDVSPRRADAGSDAVAIGACTILSVDRARTSR